MSDMASQGWLGVGGEWLEDKMSGKRNAAESDARAAEEAAKQKVLQEQQDEEKKKTARAQLLSQASSGFGANSSIARSFLTSL